MGKRGVSSLAYGQSGGAEAGFFCVDISGRKDIRAAKGSLDSTREPIRNRVSAHKRGGRRLYGIRKP